MFFLKDLPSTAMVEGVTEQVPDVSPPRVLHVLEQLRAASVLLRRIDAFLRVHGLSQTQFLALMMIVREPERDSLSAAEIAVRLDVSKPVLSKALGTLSDKGMIAVARSQPADQRQRQLELTPKGHEVFDRLLPDYFALLQGADM